MYEIEDRVRFQYPRCACVGGGFFQLEGRVVGKMHNDQWYQIEQPNGIVVVKLENIIEKLL